MKNIFIKSVLIIFIIYLSILTIIPAIINSKSIIGLIEKKTGKKIETENFLFKLTWNLHYNISFDKISVFDNNNQILYLTKGLVSTNRIRIKPDRIIINYLFLDKTKLNTNSKKSKADYKNLPKISINKAEILLYKSSSVIIENIESDSKKINLSAYIKSDLVKDRITVNKENIYIINNKLTLDNFIINFNSNPMAIKGIITGDNPNFTLSADSIPIRDIEKCFLFYSKQKKPNEKNFIENFYDFKGSADIKLKFAKKSIIGYIEAKNFNFKSVKLDIPFCYKSAIFYFEKDKIHLKTKGTFGGEKLYSDFFARDIFNNNRLTTGTMSSSISNSFAKKYLKNAKIVKRANLGVKYRIEHHSPEVYYSIDLDKGSDIYYLSSSLKNTNNKRIISAKTKKQGNKLKLERYNYSRIVNQKPQIVVYGDGLFIRKNQKLNLDYISINTNDWAPSVVLWSISKYIEGGNFKGNLKYYASKKQPIGKIILKNSTYKDFDVDLASIEANEKTATIKAKGNYKNSPFVSYIEAKNDFSNNIVINNLDMHLKSYEIVKTNKKKTKNKPEKKDKKKLTIKKAKLKLDKLTHKKILVENLALEGFAKDNIVNFSVQRADFAKGKLSAKGLYDITYSSSDINFLADNIDSNLASYMIFDLKDQFEGLASAKMHFKSYDKLKIIKAHSAFMIQKGALTKIADSEFLINNSDSLAAKLQKHINIDLNEIKKIKSDIKGSFDINNKTIENIEIFNKNKSFSFYGFGSYNIKTEELCACLFARYDKNALKKIKIFYIPLSWITKFVFKSEKSKELYKNSIEKIPPIQAPIKNQKIIRAGIKGNINSKNNLDVNLRTVE